MRLPPFTSAPRLGDRLAHYRAVPRTLRAVAFSMVMGATLLTAGCTGGTPWGATPQNLPQVNLPRLENIPAHIDAALAQPHRFFTAPAKDARIAAFEPHHAFSLARITQHQAMNKIL